MSVRQSLNQSSSLFGTPECYIHIFLFASATVISFFQKKKTTINTAISITLLETTMNTTKKITYDCGRYHLLCELLVNKWQSGSNISHPFVGQFDLLGKLFYHLHTHSFSFSFSLLVKYIHELKISLF